MVREFEGRVKYLEKVHRISEIPERSKIEGVDVENVKKIISYDVANIDNVFMNIKASETPVFQTSLIIL